MPKTIQEGRYKIRRSPDPDSLIIPADSANSLAILGPEDPSCEETGIWILTFDASYSSLDCVASKGAMVATLQHEGTQAYLAIQKPISPDQQPSILVSSDDKQAWTINPTGKTGYGKEEDYYIGYPRLVQGEVMVVDTLMLRVYPPRLALRPFEDGMTLPWRFEPVV
ncbi:hypothetical protein EC957_002021 [Mortierella hygrophila]|uniref:Uncharacterized protein n=1 Tax=Mortierella hygrophila TaxID=979708 RepID=A0A9P6K7I6_9FUNG|nr:hypothetical protein EC957_002021 [Mortierella hygrophila]